MQTYFVAVVECARHYEILTCESVSELSRRLADCLPRANWIEFTIGTVKAISRNEAGHLANSNQWGTAPDVVKPANLERAALLLFGKRIVDARFVQEVSNGIASFTAKAESADRACATATTARPL